MLDRPIGCDLANVRPIGNVCYDLQKRSNTAIGLFFLLVVGHRTIGRTRGRAINTDWRRSMTRSIILQEIVRLVLAINDRSYDQSWPPTIDRAIYRRIMREQSMGGATGRKVCHLTISCTTNRATAYDLE